MNRRNNCCTTLTLIFAQSFRPEIKIQISMKLRWEGEGGWGRFHEKQRLKDVSDDLTRSRCANIWVTMMSSNACYWCQPRSKKKGCAFIDDLRWHFRGRNGPQSRPPPLPPTPCRIIPTARHCDNVRQRSRHHCRLSVSECKLHNIAREGFRYMHHPMPIQKERGALASVFA